MDHVGGSGYFYSYTDKLQLGFVIYKKRSEFI